MTLYNKRRQFTKDEDELIRVMRADGTPFETIGRRIGVCKGLVARRATEIGIYTYGRSAPRDWSNDEDAQLKKLLMSGVTYRFAGEQLGRSEDAVRRRATHFGINGRSSLKIDLPGKVVSLAVVKDDRAGEPRAIGPTIVDLKPDQCRWPIGVNEDSEFVFCGCRRTSRAYCAEHVRIAWRSRP